MGDNAQFSSIVNSLKKSCYVCGENDKSCLDLHHLNEEKKSYAISDMRTMSASNIRKEADKCICLCANCHRKYHFNKKMKISNELTRIVDSAKTEVEADFRCSQKSKRVFHCYNISWKDGKIINEFHDNFPDYYITELKRIRINFVTIKAQMYEKEDN